MRTPFVAGNWKLNKTPDEAETLARCVVDAVSDVTGVDVAICPPFTALERVSSVVCCTGGRAGCSEYVLGG